MLKNLDNSPQDLGIYEHALGYQLNQNPYPAKTNNFYAWNKGWRFADIKSKGT